MIKNTFLHFEDAEEDDPAPMRRIRSEPSLGAAQARFRTAEDARRAAEFAKVLATEAALAARRTEKRQVHLRGSCVPCSYFAIKADGCRLRDDCPLCHFCTLEDFRKVKREKRLRAKAQARLQAFHRGR
eukprot:TRINITY_DN87701_c0_g1_i1.p1 TRINITY_DN87701_c0_g1~~TRINITY_DN87701_c0_g1_i1.p1  ORF type:complete len:129 (-),score=30.09 TRINITY_DN87701_c0_g1_i1:39-425(-)